MEVIPPPPGGDVSRACEVAVPTIVTVIVAVVLTGLRLFVRLSILKRLDWDDFFNVLAAVSKNQCYILASSAPRQDANHSCCSWAPS